MVTQDLFWHKKTVWEAMEKERKVPVSVTHDSIWNFKGAGLVQVPQTYAWQMAQDFGRLSKLPEHFTVVSFDESKSVLHLKILFLKKERPVDLQIFADPKETESRLYFRSMGPWLAGLEGFIVFKDQGRQQTEVGYIAQYPGDVGWIPNFLFGVSAEAVVHHVAEQLRISLETDYKSELKK